MFERSEIQLIRELNKLGKDIVDKFCDWCELESAYQLYVKENATNETYFVQMRFTEAALYKVVSNPSAVQSVKYDWYGERIFIEPEKFESRFNWRTNEKEFWVLEKVIPITELLLSYKEGKKEECALYELLYHTQNFIILSDKKRTSLMKFGTGYEYEQLDFPGTVNGHDIVKVIDSLRAFGGSYKSETVILGEFQVTVAIENGKTGLFPKDGKKINIRWNEDKKRAFRLIQEKKKPLPF